MSAYSTETGRRVVFIEYHDGRPHSVTVETQNRTRDGKEYTGLDHYDFDWCKRDLRLYFHLSGGGGDSEFTLWPCTGPYQVWAAKDVTLIRKDTKEGYHAATILKAPRREWPLKSLAKLLARGEAYEDDGRIDGASESETVYCSTCKDRLPSDDTYHPCDHVHWCDEAGWWSTPDERCPPGCPECLSRDEPTASERSDMARIAEGYGFATEPLDSELGDRSRAWGYYEHPLGRGYGIAAYRVFHDLG